MKKYYTRVCNFHYGTDSIKLVKNKKTLPLNGNIKISFDHIEILSRNKSRLINIKEIKNLPIKIKKKVKKDLRIVTKTKKNFSNFNFKNLKSFFFVFVTILKSERKKEKRKHHTSLGDHLLGDQQLGTHQI
jgi:hypothetical protein